MGGFRHLGLVRSLGQSLLAFAILALLPSSASASAAEPAVDKTIGAVRVDQAPVIDGRLDDAVWQSVPADDHFTQVQPAEGKPPSERTEFRVAYDDQNLYIFVRCLDDEPQGIVSRLTRRDRDVEADWVAVSIDSRNDHASAYTFQLSAAGVQVDGQFFNDYDFNID
jgi:Carbohydrate family 9 binding domain-like